MTDSLVEATQELERAYDELLPLFKDVYIYGKQIKMPKPVITIQSKKLRVNERPVFGWYKPGAWSSEGQAAVNILAGTGNSADNDEINITPEGLNRSTEEILTTMLHQMVHHFGQYNSQYRGTINPNGYHTWTFTSIAEQVGLSVKQDGSRGWSDTKANPPALEVFEKIKLKPEAFDLARKGQTAASYKGSKLKKWSCGCTNVRVAVFPFEAACKHCGKDFEYTDKDRDELLVEHDTIERNHKSSRKWNNCMRTD